MGEWVGAIEGNHAEGAVMVRFFDGSLDCRTVGGGIERAEKGKPWAGNNFILVARALTVRWEGFVGLGRKERDVLE